MPTVIAAALTGAVVFIVFAFSYWGSPKYTDVGYQPDQPVDYSHKLHAGDMGMDCRYCHSTVEKAAFAAVPPTQTCMNCHWKVKTNSLKLLPVRESFAEDKPLKWVKIHRLPDYVYFDHSAHLNAGVGCSTCHGRVDQMPKVTQFAPLSMGWCLDCHRNPAPNLRDPSEVTKMDWKAPAQPVVAVVDGKAIAKNGRVIQPPLHCSGCHR